MRILELGKTVAAVSAALFMLTSTSLADDEQPVPLSPQPSESDLSPGISVDYYYGFSGRSLYAARELTDYKAGESGPAIPMLDYNVGNDPMLTSPRENNKGMVAHMKGMLHLKEPGTYKFTALTNDGFGMTLGGAYVLDNDGVHFDQWSDIVTVEVTEPGWYDLEMFYFNRKGTATLELFWRPPWDKSEGNMAHIPTDAFAHSKDASQS